MKRAEVGTALRETGSVDQAAFLPVGVVLVAGSIATVTDVRAFRVSNVVTLPLLASGLFYHGVTGGSQALLGSLAGALFGFGALFAFYLMGGMGAGDVKLMAGVGAWLGMPLTLYVFLATGLAGGIYALALVILCGRVRETWINLRIIWHRIAAVGRYLGAEDQIEAEVQRADRRRRLIPFAAMITLGVVAAVAWTWLQTRP